MYTDNNNNKEVYIVLPIIFDIESAAVGLIIMEL